MLSGCALRRPRRRRRTRDDHAARGRWDGTALVDVKDIFSRFRLGMPRGSCPVRTACCMTVGSGDPQPPLPQPALTARAGSQQSRRQGVAVEGRRHGAGGQSIVSRAGYGARFTRWVIATLGLTVHPVTGDIWESERPNGGDEVTILKPARTSAGRWSASAVSIWARASIRRYEEGMEQPTIFWVPRSPHLA